MLIAAFFVAIAFVPESAAEDERAAEDRVPAVLSTPVSGAAPPDGVLDAFKGAAKYEAESDIKPNSIRLAVTDGEASHWVARAADGSVCLATYVDASGMQNWASVARCPELSDFAQRGVFTALLTTGDAFPDQHAVLVPSGYEMKASSALDADVENSVIVLDEPLDTEEPITVQPDKTRSKLPDIKLDVPSEAAVR